MAQYGGQAVLEGVMMRGPSCWAVAVRTPEGEIAEVSNPIDSPMRRHWGFRLPIIRGVVALGESLAIGFRALSISANFALGEVAEVRAKSPEKARKRVVKLLEAGGGVRGGGKQGGGAALGAFGRRPAGGAPHAQPPPPD